MAATEGYLGIYERPEPHLVSPDLAARQTAAEALVGTSPVLGPDIYHSNVNDGDVPAATIDAADFVVLKVSEATSYPWATSWYPGQRDRVKAKGKPVGGYHFLRPSSPEQQVVFYLSHLGQTDLFPILDVEDGAISVATVKAATRAVHDAGHKVMLYGRRWFIDHGVTHAECGADFAWKPRYGPSTLGEPATLWQYSNGVVNGTHFPSGLGGMHSDMSVVLTQLPMSGNGGPSVSEEMDDLLTGIDRRINAQGPPGTNAPKYVKAGFARADKIFDAIKSIPKGDKGEDGKDGVDGERGPRGFAAKLTTGTRLRVEQVT